MVQSSKTLTISFDSFEAIKNELKKNALNLGAKQKKTKGVVVDTQCYTDAVEHVKRSIGVEISPRSEVLNQILSELTEEDIQNGYPPCTVVYVSKLTGYPGQGFFDDLKRLKVDIGKSKAEQIGTWVGLLNDFKKSLVGKIFDRGVR